MTARAHSSATPPSLIGGRYRVIEELGRGGTAVVYRVHDISTGRELALKQLLSNYPSALFEREYYALAQLAHPRVIAVYDYGLDAAGRFYTMELLDGGDLKQWSPMDPQRACRLMLEVCSSLALLHSRRLVHRDVTPRNVRCTRDGHAKLIDFGVMAPMGPCTHIAGTPSFIAPEVVQKVSIDGRADLFSLGATLYYTLTGQAPFQVRHLSDIREAYAVEPLPPSRLARGISPALDALCASLLRIDPGQRPRSAFEVMHKLAAIAGMAADEPLGVAQAYLTTPLLCGRQPALRAFREHARGAHEQQGSALLFRSAPGLGRSRLLDACALEAKTLGATVLRAGAGHAAQFAVAVRLCEQLVQALPEVALHAADQAGVRELLFEGADSKTLRRFDDGTYERERLQLALSAWLARICETQTVLLLVDDVPRIDEASLAWLATLALSAPGRRLQLTLTADGSPSAARAWDVLQKHCTTIELRPLTRAETELLLGSVFGSVPHLPLLAERVYGLARGSPRETMLLAQHLLDAGLVSYRDGQWTLPSELPASALPASASDAMRSRIAGLSPLARMLAQCHALLGMRALSAEQYAWIARAASTAEIDLALLELLGADILQADGERYQLSHPTLAELLRHMLDPYERQARHLALYEFRVRSHETHPYLLVPHLIAAGRDAEAFDVMAASSESLEHDETAVEGLDVSSVTEGLVHLLEQRAALGRSEREAHELRRRLCAFAVVSDDALHARVAPAWLARLCRDSGLDDYRALDPQLVAAERLQRALSAAAARYAATPAHERVYTVEEAIRHLVLYVLTSIVIAVRTFDTRLMQSLPDLIEPFSSLSPALSAIWHNLLGLVESQVQCRKISAARRHRDVYEQCQRLNANDLPYLGALRGALAFTLASFEAFRGRSEAFEWAAALDADPLQRVAAMEIRHMACVVRGELEQGQRYQQQAELMALRAKVRSMFERSWQVDLEIAVLTADLAGIRRVIDEAAKFCVERPGWRAFVRVAEGYFRLLRGDSAAALADFERGLADSGAQLSVWLQAVAGSMYALSALGRDAESAALGEAALARCEQSGVELSWYRIARALALAEAKLGQPERASARIQQLMAAHERDGMFGVHRARTYELAAHLALRRSDVEAARKYALLLVQTRGGEASAAAWASLEPLLNDARTRGLDLRLGPTHFERSAPQVRVLVDCKNAAERATRVLERLCDLTQAPSAHLFLVNEDRELILAATQHAEPPSGHALEFVRRFFAQQLDDELFSEVVSRVTHMLSLPGVAMYYGEDGSDYHLVVLSHRHAETLLFVGVALLAAGESVRLAPNLVAQASALAAELLEAGDTPGLQPGTD